jgi:hypothetical protein
MKGGSGAGIAIAFHHSLIIAHAMRMMAREEKTENMMICFVYMMICFV